MKSKMKRIVAMILVCCLIVSLANFVAMAEGSAKEAIGSVLSDEGVVSESDKSATVTGEEGQDTDGEVFDVTIPHRFDETKRIKESDVPLSIGYEEALKNGHRERRRDLEEDDLYKVVFDNDDGTRTEYYFGYPVKYTDRKGNVRDVRMELGQCKEGYRTVDNSIVTTFSAKLEDGVSLSDGKVNVQLIPEFAKSTNAQLDASKRIVTYHIDDETKIEYSLTYLGFKEDIVVSEYNGVTEYDFLLYTDGLRLQNIHGEWFLVDATGTVQATVGDLIVFTADEKNNTLGEIRVETITQSEVYRMKLVVDDEYLRSPDTKYPIRIDPTIEINYNNDGSGAIEDVTINSAMGSMGDSGSIFIGKRTSGGIARTLMRFPGLDLSSIRSASQIQSAKVEIRDLMCETASMQVNCHVFTGNTWTEGSATWSNTSPNSYRSAVLSSNTVSYANGRTQSTVHRYEFDITEAVVGWKLGNYSMNKGILFKASSSTESSSAQLYKTFASYNRASYRPSLSITYSMTGGAYEGTYYINNEESGRYLGNSGTAAYQYRGLLSSLGNKIKWAIHEVGNYYVIQPSTNSSLYLCSVGTNSTEVTMRIITDGIVPTNCRWNIEYAGQYKACIKNVGTGRYLAEDTGVKAVSASSKDVWRVVTTSYYGNGNSYARRELTSSDVIFNNLTIDVNSQEISTNSTTNGIMWAAPSDFTYTVTGQGAVLNGTTISGRPGGGTVTVSATHKVTGLTKLFTVKVLKTAIVVVPGICGSNLMYEDGDPFWNAEMFDDFGDIPEEISLGWEMMTPGLDGIVPVENDYGFDDWYSTMVVYLYSEFGERSEVVFFAYDWRLSNEENAEIFAEEVADHYEKMIIISHSMGGILTSSYLAMGASARAKVKQAFFLGTPFLGAPLAAHLMSGGSMSDFYPMPNLLSAVVSFFAPSILGRMDSALELLPTEQCEVLGIDSERFFGYTSYDGMVEWIVSLFMRMQLYSPLEGLSRAKNFHEKLWTSNNQHITALVDSFYIVGTGSDTISGFGLAGINKTQLGDGAVPLWSASLNNLYPNRSSVYSGVSHMDLISNSSVLVEICDKIGGES